MLKNFMFQISHNQKKNINKLYYGQDRNGLVEVKQGKLLIMCLFLEKDIPALNMHLIVLSSF